MFSKRIQVDLSRNDLFKILDAKRESGIEVLDLTESNPTRAGFGYNNEQILQALFRPEVLRYEPEPQGLLSARQAISGYYLSHGHKVNPESLYLTSSTSEAYSSLFKLLADPGDEILVPQPSYPLFESLAKLESVRLISYPLRYSAESGWIMDIKKLNRIISTKTRSIITVNPNNPTGSYVKKGELEQINELCQQHSLSLIVDEVFLDYVSSRENAHSRTMVNSQGPLTFILSGLSKVLALPQMKLGWIQMSGPREKCIKANERLEYILDAYLSVGTPVQHAVRDLFKEQQSLQAQIKQRLRENEDLLLKLFSNNREATVLKREGGWYAVIKVDTAISEEEMAVVLLDKYNVLVHPGYFYEFENSGYMVLSLIIKPEVFRAGTERIVYFLNKPQ
jgi:aspartate/methionine/tyrosine aminotransferase